MFIRTASTWNELELIEEEMLYSDNLLISPDPLEFRTSGTAGIW